MRQVPTVMRCKIAQADSLRICSSGAFRPGRYASAAPDGSVTATRVANEAAMVSSYHSA